MTSRAVAASLYRIWKKHPRKNTWAKKRSDWMQQCTNYLVFGDYADTETGEVKRRLAAAQFCRDRLCPMCSWRKSLVMFSQISRALSWIDEQHPGLVPIFLTLTVKNCSAKELDKTLTKLLKSFSKIFTSSGRRKPWRVSVGWFRAVEITYNAKTDEWHPHIHVIVLVEPDYFTDKSKYLDHDAWVAEWRWALGADYDPSVDVRTIKGQREKAVAEVAKYTVKPGEWINLDDADGTDARVELLARVLKGRRLTAMGGIMKEAKAALKLEDVEQADLVLTDNEKAEMRGEVLVALTRFDWQIGLTNYIQTEVQQVKPSQVE